MAVKRFSTSFISESGQDKSSNFIANYSPAIDEMELIERVRVGSGGTSAIEFTNIPATYQHLQIRGLVRNTGSTQRSVSIRFNNDTASNYAFHLLYGNGSAAGAENGASQTGMQAISQVFSTATANIFSAFVIDILDYASTSKATTIRSFGSRDENGAGLVSLYSGLWTSTSAVSEIDLFPLADNFAEYSLASLYGVKA